MSYFTCQYSDLTQVKGPRLEMLWYPLVKQPTDIPTTQTPSASAASSPLSISTNLQTGRQPFPPHCLHFTPTNPCLPLPEPGVHPPPKADPTERPDPPASCYKLYGNARA